VVSCPTPSVPIRSPATPRPASRTVAAAELRVSRLYSGQLSGGTPMDDRAGQRLDGWSWAVFFVRWVLGLIFFMAGWWKTFDLGPLGHARGVFIGAFGGRCLTVCAL